MARDTERPPTRPAWKVQDASVPHPDREKHEGLSVPCSRDGLMTRLSPSAALAGRSVAGTATKKQATRVQTSAAKKEKRAPAWCFTATRSRKQTGSCFQV